MPFALAGKIGGGIVVVLLVVAIIWFISALFWGGRRISHLEQRRFAWRFPRGHTDVLLAVSGSWSRA